MHRHYIPENKFPMEIDSSVKVLGNYFFNLFLVMGSRYTALFEVGISAVVDRVIGQLEDLGMEPDYLIPSHPHSDHMTGLPGLMERYPRARVVAGRGAAEFIAHPKAGSLMLKEDAFMSQRLLDLKIQPGRPSLDHIPNLSSSLCVEDEISIDLGGVVLDLIPAKGHSPGNLMGRLPGKDILFCADSLGFHFPGRSFLPLFFTGAGDYLSTLDRISDFAPRILCPAHQGPLWGKDAAKGIQASINTTTSLIRTIQESGLPGHAMADEIFENNYKDEFTLYTPENIQNCTELLVKRAKEYALRQTQERKPQ